MFRWLKNVIAPGPTFDMESLSDRQRLMLKAVREGSLKSLKEVFDPAALEKDAGWFDYALVIESLMDGRSKGVYRFLLKNGCRVRISTRTGIYKTPLWYAVDTSNLEATGKLLRLGASIGDLDANTRSPVLLAMEQKKYDLLVTMLQLGNFDSVLKPSSRLDIEHYSVVCKINYLCYIERFVSRGFPIDQVSDSDLPECKGSAALHFAVANKSLATLDLLLGHSRNPNIHVRNSRGQTPLQLAFYNQLCDQENTYVWVISSDYAPGEEEEKIIDKLLALHLANYSNPIDENGLSHFHISCTRNLPEVVQLFLDHHVDVNARLSFTFEKYPGFAPLHLAALKNCLDVAKLLILHGAQVDLTSKLLHTPLHVACEYGHSTMVKLLVAKGASLVLQDQNGCTPVHLAFYKLPRDERLVGYLLERVPKELNPVDSQGLSHLQVACAVGPVESVFRFIERNVSVNLDTSLSHVKYSGYSALHFAVAFNRREVVELLLMHGADASATTTCSRLTPLHLACMHNWNKFYKLILGADLCNNSADWTKNREDQMEILRMLLEHGSDPDALDSSDMSALMHACRVNTFRTFCSELSGEVSYETSLKIRAALHEELQVRCLQTMNVLLSHGAKLNAGANRHGSVLHLILRENVFVESALVEVIRVLLEEGADVNATNEWAMTPLHFAVTLGHEEVVRFLLNHGANVNARNKISSTALHLAVRSVGPGGTVVIDTLLESLKCDVDARNSQGETPLHIAFSRKNVYAVKQLLKHGADVNVQDTSGSPTLFYSYDRFYLDRWDQNWLEIQKVVRDHVAMLETLGAYVSSKVRCHCETNLDEDFDEATAELVTRCTLEIERMGLVKIDVYTSLLDVLRKHPWDTAKHTRNELLRSIVEHNDLENQFPIYGPLLRAKFRRGLVRMSLVEVSLDALDLVLDKRLPESCLHEILRHVDSEGLEYVVEAKGLCQERPDEPAAASCAFGTRTNKRQRLD